MSLGKHILHKISRQTHKGNEYQLQKMIRHTPFILYIPICIHILCVWCLLVAQLCLLATPWSAGLKPCLFMGFLRQEYWSGLPFSFPIYIIYSLPKK